jgi:hypothetical protein
MVGDLSSLIVEQQFAPGVVHRNVSHLSTDFISVHGFGCSLKLSPLFLVAIVLLVLIGRISVIRIFILALLPCSASSPSPTYIARFSIEVACSGDVSGYLVFSRASLPPDGGRPLPHFGIFTGEAGHCFVPFRDGPGEHVSRGIIREFDYCAFRLSVAIVFLLTSDQAMLIALCTHHDSFIPDNFVFVISHFKFSFTLERSRLAESKSFCLNCRTRSSVTSARATLAPSSSWFSTCVTCSLLF